VAAREPDRSTQQFHRFQKMQLGRGKQGQEQEQEQEQEQAGSRSGDRQSDGRYHIDLAQNIKLCYNISTI